MHDKSRRSVVSANALRTVLRGAIFRKCIDGAFAGGIGGRIEIAPLCRARTDVDDGAAALRYHERQCMLAHQHRPACVHAHDLVPKFDRHGENITIIYIRSEEHTSELQSLMRISYAVFCLKKKKDY